ncbi:MAG: F0F1 ATP synthase subunit delta, partial [Paracoccaceae bacterium]
MSETASISSGIASRYATAVFELAKEAGTLPALERDVADLAAALDVSADFRDLISSP